MTKVQLTGNNICFVGDIHGEYSSIKNTIQYYQLNKCVIFFCGDIGLGFNKEQYYKDQFQKINRFCEKNEIELVFVRGNHDDPSYFNNQQIHLSNIRSVSDYTIVEVTTPTKVINVLCIGGAISIDRSYRKNVNETELQIYCRHHDCNLEEAKSKHLKVYWENEFPIYNENALSEIVRSGTRIDTIVTHTCPTYAPPSIKPNLGQWSIGDINLINDVKNERNVMDNIFNFLSTNNALPKYWFYGHYHWYETSEYDGVKFIMLDMCRNNKLCLYPQSIDN